MNHTNELVGLILLMMMLPGTYLAAAIIAWNQHLARKVDTKRCTFCQGTGKLEVVKDGDKFTH